MLMWLYEILAPAVLFRHIALFLLVVAMAMPTVLMLRLAALAAGVVGLILATVIAYDPVILFWSILFIAVVLVQLFLYYRRHKGRPLSAEERLFHEKVVPSLRPAQTRRLIKAGRGRDVAAGTALTRQGEIVSELCFISRGLVEIMVDGEKIAECTAGSLVGEIGVSTGDRDRCLRLAGTLSRPRDGAPLQRPRPPHGASGRDRARHPTQSTRQDSSPEFRSRPRRRWGRAVAARGTTIRRGRHRDRHSARRLVARSTEADSNAVL